MDQQTNKKPWYKSKTIWFNIVSGGVFFTEGMSRLLTGMTSFIPEPYAMLAVFAFSTINIFLRSITHTGILADDVSDEDKS